MRENRGTHNGRYLLFDDAETRGRFVVMYKDLFVPYSRVSEPVINAIKEHDDCKLKQLLEGYCIDKSMTGYCFGDDCDGYPLKVNIRPEEWNYIVNMMNLERIKVRRNHFYWRLA